ncbi:MAG: Lrp/AsnC ligand binding domain-containing protein [Nanoarchaeota archaeon]|nr:Lrp/AsnC ligand binding domain-containing protein [Nanoarchaeota archaeon]
MITAYIFVVTNPSIKVDWTAKFLKSDKVKDITEVYGKYDLIIKVKLKDINELNKFILNLRKIKGVEKTTTLISTK